MGFLYPSFQEIALALIFGSFLDLLYPEHRGVLLRLHPVHTSYFCSLRLAKEKKTKLSGLLIWILCITSHLGILSLMLFVIWLVPNVMARDLLWIIIAGVTFKLSFSPTLLLRTGLEIFKASENNETERVKKLTQGLVRRNAKELDLPHTFSATIESIAESFVDGVLSPLFYFIILGPSGALFQRVANTLDGALGFKTEEFKEVGYFSAKADDIINYIPARISVVLIAICSGKFRSVLNIWKTYRSVTESPNAGHPMATMAGALGVWLEKIGHYKINESGRDPSGKDVKVSVKIVTCSTTLSLLASILILELIHLLM